jgi:hypothetical protein
MVLASVVTGHIAALNGSIPFVQGNAGLLRQRCITSVGGTMLCYSLCQGFTRFTPAVFLQNAIRQMRLSFERIVSRHHISGKT